MLKALDVIIGFTTIILLFSLAASAIVQAITGVVNTRGAHLRDGLARLLHQLDSTMDARTAKRISVHFLCHPMISYNKRRLGDVIHRSEFTRLLLQFAANENVSHVPEDILAKVRTLVSNNGIDKPAEVLNDLRQLALKLEQLKPDLGASERESMAMLAIAPSPLLAKVHGWFDETIDRVSSSFTLNTRIYTFAASLVVVLIVQLNSVALINRLALDDAFRAAAVKQGEAMAADPSKTSAAVPCDPNASCNPLSNAVHWSNLLDVPLDGSPHQYADWWWNHFRNNEIGMLLSVFFLSFGAPFWYNALKNLLQLRSALTKKDDVQRDARQLSNVVDQTVVAAAVNTSTAGSSAGI